MIQSMGKKSYTFDEIKLKMISYCTYQDRCHQEVEQKMRDFLLIPEAKDEILLYLIQENFLNEERFARSYTRGKFYIKKWGKNKIKQHLKQKNISEKLIQIAFTEIDEEDYKVTAKKNAYRYYEKQKELNFYHKKNKTIKYMISKGFEYDVVLEILEEINI